MKKGLSLTIAVLMLAAMSLTAVAADPTYKLSVAADVTGADINAAGTMLTPGVEYQFPLKIKIDAADAVAFTEGHMTDYKFSISVTKGGTVLTTPTVEEIDGVYYLIVKPKALYTTAATEVTFRVRYLAKSPSKELDSVTYTFKVGHAIMDNADIAALAREDFVTVDPAAPIITTKQFETIGELNLYKSVTFNNSDIGWEYTVNIANAKAANLYSTNEVPMEVVKKYNEEERAFFFVSFPGKPNLGAKGRVTLNVSDSLDEFDGRYLVYLYQDGALYKLTSNYDEDESTVTFNATVLGSYVVTNMAFTGTNVSGGVTSPAGPTNPETGANNLSGVVTALAAITLVSAAAIALKKQIPDNK